MEWTPLPPWWMGGQLHLLTSGNKFLWKFHSRIINTYLKNLDGPVWTNWKNGGTGAEPPGKFSMFSGAKRMNYQLKTLTNVRMDHMAEALQTQKYYAAEEFWNRCWYRHHHAKGRSQQHHLSHQDACSTLPLRCPNGSGKYRKFGVRGWNPRNFFLRFIENLPTQKK